MKPAVVIATYNRAASLMRLLDSISQANYDCDDIPLVISIDGGGSQEVIDIATTFIWKHGKKEVIRHEKNLGLKEHILLCGELTRRFGSIVLFEDDLFVAPSFYNYVSAALEFYKDDKHVGGIATYSRKRHKFTHLPFIPYNNGTDTYFLQFPSSWGQAWTVEQWNGFKEYMDKSPEILPTDKVPEDVKWWKKSSWLKYLVKYMVEKNLFFVYPYQSHTTNFGDAGVHYSRTVSDEQVPLNLLQPAKRDYRFIAYDDCKIKYDVYYDVCVDSLKALGFKPNEKYIVDTYGIKPLDLNSDCEYALSIRPTSEVEESFDLRILPVENNVLFGIKGRPILKWARLETFSNEVSPADYAIVASHGAHDAFEAGIRTCKNSKEYKVGYKLLHPIKAVKREWRRMTDRFGLKGVKQQ